MADKANKDREIEDRLRAHVRQKMTERDWTVTHAAREMDHSQPNLTRILQGTRGISAGLAYRMSKVLNVPLDDLFHKNPPRPFWDYYVPKPSGPGSASSATVQTARQTERGTVGGGPGRANQQQRKAR